MVKKHFEPGRRRIHKRLVTTDVLFLDHGDLGVKTSARFGVIVRAHVHIVIHRLLFGGGDDRGVEFGFGRGERGRHRPRNVVERIAMLGNRGSARHDLRQPAREKIGAHVLLDVEKIGIAVEVVEVLGQCEVQRRAHILVGFVPRHYRREVDRELLVSDRVHQHGFVHRLKGSDRFLLLLLDPPRQREFAA